MSLDLKINTEDLDRAADAFGLAEKQYRTLLSDALHQIVQLIAQNTGYPPKPPGSTYVRTGKLGGSVVPGGLANIFRITTLGMSVQARYGSSLDYAADVIGKEQRSNMGHWWRLVDLAEGVRTSDSARLINEALQQLFRRVGL